ncbi:MAG: hypothetical protein ACREJD_15895 [Phycisphaerales bacterium]
MNFRVRWTVGATETYESLRAAAIASDSGKAKQKKSKAAGLFAQVVKCVTLLSANTRHPGLHTHEFHSIPNPFDPKGKVFEAYAQNRTPGAYRVFWCYGPSKSDITILAITPHP